MAPVGYVRCSPWWRLFLAVLLLNGVYSQSATDIRLEDGWGYDNRGRVEVFYNGQWNRICDDYFGLEEAEVVCRQLGYGTNDVGIGDGNYYSSGTGPFLEMDCSGGYLPDLTDCSFTEVSYPYFCDDAGVECGSNLPATTIDPFEWLTTTTDNYGGIYDVRLVNGPSSSEGRVEIFYNGQWNTICDDNWGLDEAQVVCRQLGYDTDNVEARSSAYYGQGSGPIRQVECYGWEYTLDSCTVTSGDYICNHYEDAGVKCGYTTPQGTLPRVIGAMSFVGVSLFLLTIAAAVGVLFVCTQPKRGSTPMGMQEPSAVTTTPATALAATTPLNAPLRPDVPV